jgi:hypothetical protein
MRLVLHNAGRRDVELAVVSPRQRFDFVVLDSAGHEVWSRLHNEDIDLVRFAVVVRAGDSLVAAEQWDQRDNSGRAIPAGSYSVRGYISPRTPTTHVLPSAVLRVCAAAEAC